MSAKLQSKYIWICASIILIAFIIMILQHPFDPNHIILDIDDEEAIIIIHQNHTNIPNNISMHESPSISINDVSTTSTTSTTSNPSRIVTENTFPFSADDIILGDPWQNKQCQNALINHYNISMKINYRQILQWNSTQIIYI